MLGLLESDVSLQVSHLEPHVGLSASSPIGALIGVRVRLEGSGQQRCCHSARTGAKSTELILTIYETATVDGEAAAADAPGDVIAGLLKRFDSPIES